ncbi:MAG: DEAD/DEAH box helicase family protein [Chloroflexi bacterium]|nr:DEAD/DEAH box helicase family protein [Chloroflexota bacterium]MCY3696584.1 DEAD/DEAH box helicase family protein [Chloroflexota bacterium]
MQNAFAPYEADFEGWVEAGFQPSRPETADYLRFLADPEDERLPRPGGLWRHQWDALLRVVYAREVGGRSLHGDGVLVNIVTGGGKTALIAATMVWLRLAYDVQRFLILCPNLIVRDRLEDDFHQGKVFVDRELIPPDAVVSAEDFALTTLGGDSKSTASDLFGSNVVLANIHQFYQNSTTGKRNLAAFLEMNQTPFAIFNDEAHNTPAPEYDRTLETLAEHGSMKYRLDTTATPDRADEQPIDSKMIFEYDIPAALNDRVIATPVVYQPSIDVVELTYTDAISGETRRVEEIDWDEVENKGLTSTQWVTDTKPMSQQIEIACNRLKEAKRHAKDRYRPILFVVAVCKADAKKAQAMLSGQFKLRTLLVTEDEDDSARKDAAEIAKKDKYDAVVSVAMLREGWDVPEVAVILPLRRMGSRVYGPQIIGRGLRRVRRPDISDDEAQICAVVDHPKLEHDWLWALLQAKVEKDVGVQQEFDALDQLPEPKPRQEMVNPELAIEIPEATDDESDYEPVVVEPSDEPIREWRDRLAGLEYDPELIEITDQTISAVTSQELGAEGWTSQHNAPEGAAEISVGRMSREDLAESIRERVKSMSGEAITKHGYSTIDQRYVYRASMRHLEERFLGEESVDYATESDLRRSFQFLPQLERFLFQRGDIVGGMIEYADD